MDCAVRTGEGCECNDACKNVKVPPYNRLLRPLG